MEVMDTDTRGCVIFARRCAGVVAVGSSSRGVVAAQLGFSFLARSETRSGARDAEPKPDDKYLEFSKL